MASEEVLASIIICEALELFSHIVCAGKEVIVPIQQEANSFFPSK